MLINAISIIMGLMGTIALAETMSFELERTAFGNSMTAFLFVTFAVAVLRYTYSRICTKDIRGAIYAGVYSLGFSFALVAGKQLHTVENFAMGEIKLWIQTLALAAFFTGPVLYVFQWFANRKEGEKKEAYEDCKGCSSLKTFFVSWLIIFVCWMPVFFAFYPGAFVYDAKDEYVQVANWSFTKHHPLLHVLLLGGSVHLGNVFWGSFNVGIAAYTLFQMLVLSAVFAYTIAWIRKYLSKYVCIGCVLFYALFPIFPMYAVCSAKDTLFNAAFLIMLLQMIKLLEAGSKKSLKECGLDVILFVVVSALMMLLRNNGKMAYMVLLAGIYIFALMKWKKERFFMRLAVMMILSFVLYAGVDKALTFALQAQPGGKQEILTVPIQQLARTYKYSPEAFSQEDKEILFSYIPEDVLLVYDADLSDIVKVHFNNDRFIENSREFLGLWLRMFAKKPVTYVNAWFMTSYGFWYPDTVINVYAGLGGYSFQYEESSYFGFETEPPGERDSKFPWLEEQYRKMSLELYQQNVPGISMLFSPGFLFWVFMGCAFISMYRKQYVWVAPMAGIFLLWGTVILGPTFLVRYVLVFWFVLPMLVVSVLSEKVVSGKGI